MRIEVIGSRGQLGRAADGGPRGHGHAASGHDVEFVDIRDPGSVASLLEEVRPDAVINCAAWTRVDAAET